MAEARLTERERVYEELRSAAEKLLEELDADRARLLAADAGVTINGDPIVVERGVYVKVSDYDPDRWSYAYAWIRLYLPWYIVEVRKYVGGGIEAHVEPAVNVDASCSCGEG